MATSFVSYSSSSIVLHRIIKANTYDDKTLLDKRFEPLRNNNLPFTTIATTPPSSSKLILSMVSIYTSFSAADRRNKKPPRKIFFGFFNRLTRKSHFKISRSRLLSRLTRHNRFEPVVRVDSSVLSHWKHLKAVFVILWTRAEVDGKFWKFLGISEQWHEKFEK